MNQVQMNTEKAVIEAFEKASRLRDGEVVYPRVLKAGWLETPVGAILVAGDDDALYLLNFIDQTSMIRKTALVQKKLQANLELGSSRSVDMAKREIQEYFAGKRRAFETPLALQGTVFQNLVWETLRGIPFGETLSYTDLARKIDKPSAFRAVAQANAQNPLAIIVPCHRVINADGELGGYSAGQERKSWLLAFEKTRRGDITGVDPHPVMPE